MTLLFIRAFFLILSGFVGFYIGSIYLQPWVGMLLGIGAAVCLMILEMNLQRVSVRGLSSMVFGLVLGVIMAKLVADILTLLPLGPVIHATSRVTLTLMFAYLGAVMALRGKDEFNIIIPYVRFKRQDMDEQRILVDTSALIDGRIIDLYQTRFLSGCMIVPRCVLQELQTLADSQDPSKRQKGRRGLEILRKMQADAALDLRIHDEDIPGAGDVDDKLVRLARVMDSLIFTTDYNLGRVASLQGVTVLNVNELQQAVRPVLLAGEELELKLIREGKEPGQAVGYSDDGTLVVVADARDQIDQRVRINVTSVLQTQSGRIIFGKRT